MRRRSLLHATITIGCTFCVLSAAAQAASGHASYPSDVAVTYTAQHSLKAATNQGFWTAGGSLEVGVPVFHDLGPAINVTGSHAGSMGSSGVPLSLVTVTVGPRYRMRVSNRVSVYGEALVGLARGFQSLFPDANQLAPNTRAVSFALQAGGGVDYQLSHAFALRPVSIAYVRTQLPNGTNNTQNSLQLGAGLSWRFGKSR